MNQRILIGEDDSDIAELMRFQLALQIRENAAERERLGTILKDTILKEMNEGVMMMDSKHGLDGQS